MKNFLTTTLLLSLVACADHNGSQTSAEEDYDFYCGDRWSLSDFLFIGADEGRDWLVTIVPSDETTGTWVVESRSSEALPALGTFPSLLSGAVAEVRNLDPGSEVLQTVALLCVAHHNDPNELTVGLGFFVNDRLVALLEGERRWVDVPGLQHINPATGGGRAEVFLLTDVIGGLDFMFPRFPLLVTDGEGSYIDYSDSYDPALGF
jgi:hypothetical protein